MAVFFLFLGIDEYFEIHEYANTVIKEAASHESMVSALAHHSWIYPFSGLIFVSLILLGINIYFQHRRQVRIRMIAGMVCFVFILFFEIIGGKAYGNDSYVFYVGIEEGLEMLGLVFFYSAGAYES